jgi:hypothetical protein
MAKVPMIPEATFVGAEVRLRMFFKEGNHGRYCVGLRCITPLILARIASDSTFTGHKRRSSRRQGATLRVNAITRNVSYVTVSIGVAASSGFMSAKSTSERVSSSVDSCFS